MSCLLIFQSVSRSRWWRQVWMCSEMLLLGRYVGWWRRSRFAYDVIAWMRCLWNKFCELSCMPTRKNISLKLKGKVYAACVRCSMIYGSWTWSMNEEQQSRLVGWLFKGTSIQKGQFVPTTGEGNMLSRLGMANEIQCILPYITR